MARPDTRTRILVTSLTLFNEHGEPNTTTNDIADETDISPGNLHYHFRRKSDIVGALLGEFQADARHILQPPSGDESAVEEFWGFLQLLIELLTAYRFLVRDTETLAENYPGVRRAIKGFAKGLLAVLELHVIALRQNEVVDVDDAEVAGLCRNMALVAIFSDRFDAVLGRTVSVEKTASRIAGATIAVLLPYARSGAAAPLLEHYRE